MLVGTQNTATAVGAPPQSKPMTRPSRDSALLPTGDHQKLLTFACVALAPASFRPHFAMSIPTASADSLPGEYKGSTPAPSPYAVDENIPVNLRRATHRLQFPPSYVAVGFYRLLSDPKLRVPAWNKCKHGFMRGATVGLVWVSSVHWMVGE